MSYYNIVYPPPLFNPMSSSVFYVILYNVTVLNRTKIRKSSRFRFRSCCFCDLLTFYAGLTTSRSIRPSELNSVMVARART